MDADEFGDTGGKVAPKWEYPGKVEPEITEEEKVVTETKIEAVDSEVEDVKQSIPKEVFTQKLLDELECGVNPHKLMCLEKDETSDNDTTTISDDK